MMMTTQARKAKYKKIEGPYKLTMLVLRPDKRKRDLDNLLKATSDALVIAGAISDDSACVWIEAKWLDDADYECALIVEAVGG